MEGFAEVCSPKPEHAYLNGHVVQIIFVDDNGILARDDGGECVCLHPNEINIFPRDEMLELLIERGGLEDE